MEHPAKIHLAFKVEYRGIVRELITQAKIKLPSVLTGRDHFEWTDANCVWDTGATNSVITLSIVKKLNLVPTGKATVNGINSSEERDTYMVDIGLPNRVIVPNVTVTECNINSPGIDLLVGMNIIQLGDFAVSNGPGRTIFSFAIPPFPNPIDLVAKSKAVNPKKLR